MPALDSVAVLLRIGQSTSRLEMHLGFYRETEEVGEWMVTSGRSDPATVGGERRERVVAENAGRGRAFAALPIHEARHRHLHGGTR